MQETTTAASNANLNITEDPDSRFKLGELVYLGPLWYQKDRYLHITYNGPKVGKLGRIATAIMAKVVRNDSLDPTYSGQFLGHDYMMKLLGIEDELAPFKRSDRFRKAVGIPGFVIKGPLVIDEAETRRVTLKDTILQKARGTTAAVALKKFYYVQFAPSVKAIWIEEDGLECEIIRDDHVIEFRKQKS